MVQLPKYLALVGVSVVALAATRAIGAEWSARADVTPRVVYTDNVCLSADNEESEVYAEVTPSGAITGSGRRANVSVATSVDVNSLSDGALGDSGCNTNDRDKFFPRLNAKADAELVEQWLFIDANATVSQNEVNSFRSGGGDSADRTGNTNTTARYSISPYISRRFKDVANVLLRYEYDDQYNSKDVVGDSLQESWQLIIGSGPVFSPLFWSLQGDYEKTDYSDTPGRPTENDSELKSARFNLGYQIDRRWQVNGFVGQEWNDFVSSNDDIDGTFWDVGLRWTPNSRTIVEAGTGDRFFGTTPRLSITHSHKRSRFRADYRKELTYSRDIRTQSIDDDSDSLGSPTSLTNSPILNERFNLSYAYAGRRSALSINASHSDQTREGGAGESGLILDESTFKRISVSLRHPLSRKLSLTGRASWYEREPKRSFDELDATSETWVFSLRADRPLNENINLSLDYMYSDRQSDNPLDEYQENRITLSVRFNLI